MKKVKMLAVIAAMVVLGFVTFGLISKAYAASAPANPCPSAVSTCRVTLQRQGGVDSTSYKLVGVTKYSGQSNPSMTVRVNLADLIAAFGTVSNANGKTAVIYGHWYNASGVNLYKVDRVEKYLPCSNMTSQACIATMLRSKPGIAYEVKSIYDRANPYAKLMAKANVYMIGKSLPGYSYGNTIVIKFQIASNELPSTPVFRLETAVKIAEY
jgi:hypothetical protein